MNDKPERPNAEFYLSEFEDALSRSDINRALTVARDGYNLALSTGDKLHERIFLGLLDTASSKLMNRLAGEAKALPLPAHIKTCSFCYQTIKNAMCVAGANVSICADCIDLAFEALHSKTKK